MIRLEQIPGEAGLRLLRMGRSAMGRGWYFTAAYWVDGLLVDSGCAHTEGELLAALQGLEVHTIVNTHSHEDHIAGNAALQATRGARVLAHPLAVPVLAAPTELDPQHLYRRVFWGHARPSVARPVGQWVQTEHHRFEVFHTPGHSQDHISLFEPDQGWLLVGDTFVGGLDRAQRPFSDPWQTAASLERLRALDARLMCPGSGTIYRDVADTLGRKIDYLRQTGQRVLDLHREGHSVRRIRREVLGRDPLLAHCTQGDFGGAHLVRAMIANAPMAAREPTAHAAAPAA